MQKQSDTQKESAEEQIPVFDTEVKQVNLAVQAKQDALALCRCPDTKNSTTASSRNCVSSDTGAATAAAASSDDGGFTGLNNTRKLVFSTVAELNMTGVDLLRALNQLKSTSDNLGGLDDNKQRLSGLITRANELINPKHNRLLAAMRGNNNGRAISPNLLRIFSTCPSCSFHRGNIVLDPRKKHDDPAAPASTH